MTDEQWQQVKNTKHQFQLQLITKIEAIKRVRKALDYPLRDAKNLVETWDNGYYDQLRKAIHQSVDSMTDDKVRELAISMRLIMP